MQFNCLIWTEAVHILNFDVKEAELKMNWNSNKLLILTRKAKFQKNKKKQWKNNNRLIDREWQTKQMKTARTTDNI